MLPAVHDIPLECGPDVPKNSINPQDFTENEKGTGPVITALLNSLVAKMVTSEMVVGVTGFLEIDLQHL